MLTDHERRILRYWQDEPSLTPGEIGEKVGLSAAQVARRMKTLRQRGVVKSIEAQINWPALGYAVEVSLRITLDKTVPRAFDEFLAAAREVPEVIEIQTFLGRVDARLNLIARNMPHYQEVYRDRILTLPHIADIEALMHVARIKAEEVYPL
ncbi:Lrp/AsnC family transcriptional regulator [Rhodophyticola porphyridii]|uniref:Lrp/AsnC family transcriptional regulator n=1 Tax=Rhodophyticola porphyridii TaxID=1852017 RepID=A0A3L9Y466_9RHOB|nr:Lrp/AsnC family transcriptional regulator [Rhodophyticola porphyridii]RMA40916.1 Lrp/AsnC family transcriptional regulator [Rhodophyticola porphyridii]